MINIDKIDSDMHIDNSSIFRLEQSLMETSRKEANYHRGWADAVKHLDLLSLRLATLEATIMDEQIKKAEKDGKPIPTSALASIRRIRVPLDKRYIALKKEWIDAKDVAETLKGFSKAWEGRGYRLGELVKIAKLTHGRSSNNLGVAEQEELNDVGSKLI